MSYEALSEQAEYPLRDFEGKYVGFGPTDESAIGLGEIEVTVDNSGIKTRWATGLEVQEESLDMAEVHEFTEREVREQILVEGAEINGLRVFNISGLQWVFFNTQLAPEAPQLLIRGGMGDILGPTMLFNPAQIAEGLHERAFAEFEAELGRQGDLPRLHNGGVAHPEDNSTI